MAYDALKRIQDALDAAMTPPLPFDAGLEAEARPEWHTVARPDGLIVRLDARGAGVTPAQQASADALVMGLDLTTTGLATAEVLALRAGAKALFDDLQAEGKRDRAIALTLVDTLNVLRSWLRDFKTAVAAAQTLVDLKAKVALLPNLPDIQPADARNAVRAKLDSGTVDSPPP